MKKAIAIILAVMSMSALCAPVRSMLGAQGAINKAKTSGGWKNPYITDGLVAMWDVKWNQGTEVHEDVSQTWVDIVNGIILIASSNKQFTDTGVVGEFTVDVPSVIEEVMTSGLWTICAMTGDAPTSTSGSDKTAIATINIDGKIYGCAYMYGFLRAIGGGSGVLPNLYQNAPSSLTLPYSATFIYDNGFGNYYYCNTAIIIFSSQTTRVPLSIKGKLMIGGSSPLRRVCIYNRKLTEAEIQHNYQVDKKRFNLP